jgi:NADPH:quinone reductase-like Zn-dependent oxidoreductase
LIHSGAGGVGQAAISVCQYYGCEIYVTVGTDDKRQFLQKEFGIPADHIFSSRDIQFKYAIKQATKGKGVNLVLNSLTGDKLDASYDIIADCGRFVEIGKYDLQLNKQLGMTWSSYLLGEIWCLNTLSFKNLSRFKIPVVIGSPYD